MAEGAKGKVEPVELAAAEQAAGRRMAESRATIPDFTVEREIALPGEASTGALIAAFGRALREHAKANASYRDGRLNVYSRVNVGVAELRGLGALVPTIFDADGKSALEIDSELSALAERGEAGTLGPPELSGATATLTDLRSAGAGRVTPIIQPPQVVALGVGSGRDGVVLTLVCDRRALAPGAAAELLETVARGI